jgi:RNA polymerase sigma factor (sigma-70 family)
VEREEVTDADLVKQVARGDEAALRELFDRHAAWLRLRLLRRTSDADLVADVLQDTFVAVWSSARRYRGEGDVGAWIWGIAIRRLISKFRGHQEPLPASAEVISAATPVMHSAEDELLVAVEHGDLGSALHRLSPELHAVVQATVLDGLTTKEAGRLLGLPQGTVKSRMRAAKVQLRGGLLAGNGSTP